MDKNKHFYILLFIINSVCTSICRETEVLAFKWSLFPPVNVEISTTYFMFLIMSIF